VIFNRLLAEGGITTTGVSGSNEQWDQPNGWAPLHWMAIQGLNRYGHEGLASEIRKRWLNVVAEIYTNEAKLVEKYVLRSTTEHAGGGEYPLQDGFGWTNGVTFRLLQEDPAHAANFCHAASRK
jgi:alpha,alpha-trehalase